MAYKPCGRVGYWFSEKKGRKFNFLEMTKSFNTSGLEFIKIDLLKPLEKQGPFDAIVHKMSDIIVKADAGDEQSKEICKAFQEYVDRHPNLVVVDSFHNVRKLLDRYTQYNLIAKTELCKKNIVFIPAFVELTTNNVSVNLARMKAAEIDFPIVCKPSLAHGAPLSHQMCLIFNEEGLNDISPPCVVQKIINHNAVLYKLLIIGEKYFIVERPSLKNLYPSNQKTIFFDSNDISKPFSTCELTTLDSNEKYFSMVFPEKEKMDKIVETLHECIGLNLLNIDVIVDNMTGGYAIVDVNVFPGYLPEVKFYDLLRDLVSRKIQEKVTDTVSFYKPVLLDCFFSPALKLKREGATFSLNSSDIVFPTSESYSNDTDLSKCFCCPISGSCCNSARHLSNTSCHSLLSESMHLSKANGEMIMNRQNGAHDDSGIETSDSCDEKKAYCKIKYQHSKAVVPQCSAVNESC